jgi:short-subunit dehydrogenase
MQPAETRPLAIVTGASSGIGHELAAQFAEGGFDLVVAAEDERIGATARSLAERNAHAIPVQADLATFEGVEALSRAVQATGRIPEALAIAGSAKNKTQAAAGRVLPETAKAKVQAQQTEPGSGGQ